MKGENMDNIIHKIENICITDTHVYDEQNIVTEKRHAEGIRTGRNKMTVALIYLINPLKKHNDAKRKIDYL